MTDDSNNHLKRWWNSFEPGDLVRQKKEFIGTPLRFWARMASMGIFEFPPDTLFLCLEVVEDGEVWNLLAPGGEQVLCRYHALELVRFASEKDEEETDDKECV